MWGLPQLHALRSREAIQPTPHSGRLGAEHCSTAQRSAARTCCPSWLTLPPCRLLSSSIAGTLRRLSPPLPTPAVRRKEQGQQLAGRRGSTAAVLGRQAGIVCKNRAQTRQEHASLKQGTLGATCSPSVCAAHRAAWSP